MNSSKTMYKRHRFPPEIIQYAVWLYYKFNLSHRDVEDLLAERGITVSYEAIHLWCNKIVSLYARGLRRNGKAAKRFFRRILKKYHDEPRIIVTDKLGSYRVAHRELIPDTIHDTRQYANNRAELSHQPTRMRER